MKNFSKQGFSKTKVLIAIGAFILVVAISVPLAFGFVKEDHPDININSNNETTETIPSDLKEVELDIIKGVLPNDMEFSTQTEANITDVTEKDATNKNSSEKTEAPEKITGTIHILEGTVYVENKGAVVDVPEEQEYTKVHVDSSLTIPLPKDFDNGSKKEDDDRKVIEVEAEKSVCTDEKSNEQFKQDAEELFGDSNNVTYFPAKEANPDDYAVDIYELFGRTGTIEGKPVNPDEYSFDVNDIDGEALWDELNNQ